MQKGIPFVRELFIRAKRMHLFLKIIEDSFLPALLQNSLKNGDHLSEPDRLCQSVELRTRCIDERWGWQGGTLRPISFSPEMRVIR